MSQNPPPAPPTVAYEYIGAPVPRKNNGMAIASLVCGLIMCVPLLTQLLAILFGWIGIRRARDPQSGSKGIAIAGLLLGIVGIVGWAAFGGAMLILVSASAPGRAVARQFLQDLSSGNASAAKMACVPDLSQSDITATSQKLQAWGPLADVTFTGVNMEANAGSNTKLHLDGRARFANGTHTCEIDLVKLGGTYQVKGYNLEP